jgi:hypothetical protein
METRTKFNFPWATLFIAMIVPIVTVFYSFAPHYLLGAPLLWITSPFNISYELANGGFIYNYILLIVIYAIVELHTRNLAKLRSRDSLIRNAVIFSILSAYIASAIIWIISGFPSAGTSILAFNILIFAFAETYDVGVLKIASEKTKSIKSKAVEVPLAYGALVLVIALIFFVYLNDNIFWYAHILGGAIFAIVYFIYLNRRVKERVDMFEETLEKEIKKDIKKV